MAFLPERDNNLQISLSTTRGITDNRGIVEAIMPDMSAVQFVIEQLRTLEAPSAFIWVDPKSRT